MKNRIVLVFIGTLLAIGAVAAQQPTTSAAATDNPANKPATADKTAERTAAVLAALKGNAPAAIEPEPFDASSLTTVLERYARMAATGQQAPAPAAPPIPTATRHAAATTAGLTGSTTGGGVLPQTPAPRSASTSSSTADSLDAIRAELRALINRLDALLTHKEGGQ